MICYCQNVLVASVDFKTSQGWNLYKIVLDAAINHLKTDPLQIYVKWCVATWSLGNKEPLIKLLLWNRTLVNNIFKNNLIIHLLVFHLNLIVLIIF